MNHLIQNKSLKYALILGQFFLIIFVYHLLKDLKDSLVITASDAGAEVIPFIKIWTMLPLSIAASFLFGKLYQKWGRSRTLYFFMATLLSCYALFAFYLYPEKEKFHLEQAAEYLRVLLPMGCKGMISMISHWIYTFFYLAAELWSLLILSVLFWGYVNHVTPVDQAKRFYPLCVFVGNCAGIVSGQTSHFLSYSLTDRFSWETALQVIILMVIASGVAIMAINYCLSRLDGDSQEIRCQTKDRGVSFKKSLLLVLKSPSLFCIAVMVVGFALTSNLIEVVWKQSIKNFYPSAHEYNAYVNQLTSLIGISAVIMALFSRWLFKTLNWSTIAMMTPIALFTTSSLFFLFMQLPQENLKGISSLFQVHPLYLVMTLGSIYYVIALTAKYTIFDMTKEIAFLSVEADERMRGKGVIDSIGSRLGKSGASSFYQVLLVLFGSTAGHLPVIAVIALFMISMTIVAARKLGRLVPSQ